MPPMPVPDPVAPHPPAMPSESCHVDVFSNDPLSGSETLIGKIHLDDSGKLELVIAEGSKASHDQIWEYLSSRVSFDPDENAQEFLNTLAESIDATYVGATDAHDDENCPFTRVVYMRA